jgi:hypothetical protein
MAIWQFNLNGLTKEGIDREVRSHSTKLDRGSLKSLNLWDSAHLNTNEVISRIDGIVKRTDYGDENWFNWKTYTEEVDNDANLSLDELTKKVEDLSFQSRIA